jgi:hypothetical protein
MKNVYEDYATRASSADSCEEESIMNALLRFLSLVTTSCPIDPSIVIVLIYTLGDSHNAYSRGG